ncbi:unnamed protein product [Pedinophyceae sp. YPF-701]|nr:unnamed protein product [Pedinophyceae sp. YPF-701]
MTARAVPGGDEKEIRVPIEFPREYLDSTGVELSSLSVDEATAQGTLLHVTQPVTKDWPANDVMPFNPDLYGAFPRVEAPSPGEPIVILPGFGNETGDYEAPFGVVDAAIATALRRRGFSVHVLQVERKDWFQVAKGLLSLAFWQKKATVDPGYRWYLDRADAAVREAVAASDGRPVTILGHSAGGWLARAYLADPKYRDDGAEGPNPNVRALVTLGSPHRNTFRDMVGTDRTGGLLGSVDAESPGARFAGEGVRYVCVAGRAVRGRQAAEKGQVQLYAHNSYLEVCGEGEGVEGDAVVPTRCSFLPGATNVLLDGVFHSMSRVGTFEEGTSNRWYGSEDVIDSWLGRAFE